MFPLKIESLPADLGARLRRLFPGAVALTTDLRFVRCIGFTIGDRFGGDARLGTCPTSAALVEDIQAWMAAEKAAT